MRRRLIFKATHIEEFIVLCQRHIANRSLSPKGQCGFVCGSVHAAATMKKRHPVKSQRPAGSLGEEDRMHPGEGGA